MILAMRRVQLSQTKSLSKRHPWVYSGAVSLSEKYEKGELVYLMDKDQCLATAYADPGSKILFRVLDWQEASIDLKWWIQKFEKCFERRQPLLKENTAFRLVHGEGEGLPGLIVDYYDGFLCLQAQSEGLMPHLEIIATALDSVLSPKGIFERSDSAYRARQGHESRLRWLKGNPPQEPLWVKEKDVFFHVDLIQGQKSGHYCDQRENRQRVASYAQGARVLDLCCNTGGFSLSALLAGAKHVTSVDSSQMALSQLKENAERSCPQYLSKLECLQKGLVEALDQFSERGQVFDFIVLDPPKLAPKRSDVPSAMRAYKDFNRRAIKCLAAGGYLASFSCSSAISREDLLLAVSWAALDVGVTLLKVADLSQPFDHPVNLFCPESEYLKGFIFKLA